jgi:hypothetical protein
VADAEAGVPIKQCLLVQQEIWRVVSEAAKSGLTFSPREQAERIAAEFPAAGFSSTNLADALVYAALECDLVCAPRPTVRRQRPPIVDLIALVGGRRKTREAEHPRPRFAAAPIPVTT